MSFGLDYDTNFFSNEIGILFINNINVIFSVRMKLSAVETEAYYEPYQEDCLLSFESFFYNFSLFDNHFLSIFP